MSKSTLLMFSSRIFMVSSLTFKPLIHFEFIFIYDVRECSNFILLHVVVQLSQQHLLVKKLSFSSVYSHQLCHRLVDHRSMGLFLVFLSYSIIHKSVVVPVPYCFDYCNLVVWSEYSLLFYTAKSTVRWVLSPLHLRTKLSLRHGSWCGKWWSWDLNQPYLLVLISHRGGSMGILEMWDTEGMLDELRSMRSWKEQDAENC